MTERGVLAQTERLVLRPGRLEEAGELTAAIAHWDVARMLERLPWPYAIADARWWLSQPRPAGRPEPLIIRRDTGAIVGGIGLIEKGDVELGYWLTLNAWGQGTATEAARALVAFGRDTLGLTRVVSDHFIDNPASGRVLAKAGFRPTGAMGTRFCLARGEEVAFVEFAWVA